MNATDQKIDCSLCADFGRCLWRWQTDAMRHQHCEDYDPITINDLNYDQH